MAQIINGGSLTFDALVYGQQHPGTAQFLSQQFEQPTTMLTQAGQQFFAAAYDMYDRISGSDAMRALKAVGRSLKSAWDTNTVRELSDLGAIQTAGTVMQRWVMAMPELRELHRDQRVDGYSDTYVDHDPGKMGEAHYDYRRVMDGVVQEVEDGDWVSTTYLEELLEEDQELALEEQMDILNTWQAIRGILKHSNEDPTSIYNAERG